MVKLSQATLSIVKKNAYDIVTKGGEYLLQVKANQPHLLSEGKKLELLKTAPDFVQTNSGHGRVEVRSINAFDIDSTVFNFPFARTLLVLHAEVTHKKSGKITTDVRYYISSALPTHYRPEQWINLIRGHWGGVEIRNHWRRDAIMGEDKSRTHNVNALANLALMRNVLLVCIRDHFTEHSLPQVHEALHSKPVLSFSMLTTSC